MKNKRLWILLLLAAAAIVLVVTLHLMKGKPDDDKKPAEPAESAAAAEFANTDPDVADALRAAGVKPGDVVEIQEKMFLTTVYDITFNPDNYKDKVIALEGMFEKLGNIVGVPEAEQLLVYRRSPGCCGNDGFDGFEIKYSGKMPNFNDWVKVYGILRQEKTDGAMPKIYLEVISMKVLQTRGAEFVEQ